MKTVLITGCSSGIGKAAVSYFQKKGWNVAATMRSPEKETGLSSLANVKCFPLDVRNPDSVGKAVREAADAFGSIDAVVNNAGFSLIGPFETTHVDDIARQFDTNLFGMMNVIREILPLFRRQKGGTIVNIASMGGKVGFPLYSLYNSTKFAVEGFSEALQYELEQFGVRVKIIEPGVIKTDFYGRSMTKTHNDDDPVYGQYAGKSIEKLMAFGKNGISPDRVAKKIFKAASSKNRRLRYSIGPDAKLLLVIQRFFPFSLLRRIIKRIS
jgi:short-subunit dehydrogenase